MRKVAVRPVKDAEWFMPTDRPTGVANLGVGRERAPSNIDGLSGTRRVPWDGFRGDCYHELFIQALPFDMPLVCEDEWEAHCWPRTTSNMALTKHQPT
jgi:hypothetical protein